MPTNRHRTIRLRVVMGLQDPSAPALIRRSHVLAWHFPRLSPKFFEFFPSCSASLRSWTDESYEPGYREWPVVDRSSPMIETVWQSLPIGDTRHILGCRVACRSNNSGGFARTQPSKLPVGSAFHGSHDGNAEEAHGHRAQRRFRAGTYPGSRPSEFLRGMSSSGRRSS